GARIEKVQRYLVGSKFGQRSGKLRSLRKGLTHPDDPSAAHLHPQLAYQLKRLPSLLPSMRAHDLREVRPGGLKVVVVTVHTELTELHCLRAREDSQRAGNVDI